MKRTVSRSGCKDFGTVAIFDLDGTLFTNTLPSSIMQLLSQKIYRLSLKLQKPNQELVTRTHGYDRVIIVTSRSKDELLRSTVRQLRKNHVRYDKLIMFPSTRMKLTWKKTMMKRIAPTDWYDDLKPEILRADQGPILED